MESERISKQEYLVQSVKKRGYDVTKFASYLGQKRQGGTDVDVWTMEELQKVRFIA